eukprot:TRINITY_DN106702_c0_g1_i1.p1 TRINITY_DN106702_c0_g1~~TRINITY_DN106702_c0_g1_i1.p1  ORF type:complete len:341 (+),score=63.68 TRINITY_DN106702_c0_g1_i1:66-1088(+)
MLARPRIVLMVHVVNILVASAWPLTVLFRESFNSSMFEELNALQDSIAADWQETDLSYRSFENDEGLHHALLEAHRHFASHQSLQNTMLRFAIQADQDARWGITPLELKLRRVELLHYAHVAGHQSDLAGWHIDGGLLTVVVMLSEQGEFEGGRQEVRFNGSTRKHELSRGDVMVWRGWTEHRVTPVTDGIRKVFIVEFWSGADVAFSMQPNAANSPESLEAAIKSDPTSGMLQMMRGVALCGRLPCQTPLLAAEAEVSFRLAVQLEPESYKSWLSLGIFLGGASDLRRLEALVALWSACKRQSKDALTCTILALFTHIRHSYVQLSQSAADTPDCQDRL